VSTQPVHTLTNSSTIDTLKLLNNTTIFTSYKFAVVTFEHDIYRGDFFNTREESRKIFNNNGYVLVFGDVKNFGNSLVDMDYINKIKTNESLDWTEIIEKL